MTRAGALRHRVVVLRPTTTKDARGGEVVTWSDETERWANVEPLAGREYFASQQMQGELTHRVTMRYDPDLPLRPKWRLQFKGRILDIETILPIEERNHEWQLMCRELV